MHKKLIAAAVAGVLAAPAVAVAQSTVQIYGVAEWEWGHLDQGAGRPGTDFNESTGSYIGFRGTEALGGGLSAWFQCETTADIRAFDQVGLCSRNSGLGLRGGFGNAWVGRWHTPMSRAIALGSVGVEETGILGMSYMHGGSGSTSLAGAGFDTGGGTATRQRWRRRETCLATYETPSMGGFMVGTAISCGNAAAEGAAVDGANNTKPRLWSLAGTYVNGPLAVGLAYEKHYDVGPFNVVGPDIDDRGWGASVAYTFGPVKLGSTFMERRWGTIGNAAGTFGLATGAVGEIKNRTWTIGVEWTIAGPHQLHFGYGDTGDTKGEGPSPVANANGGAPNPGGDTGYKGFSIGYQYSLSPRTIMKVGYTRFDNDSNSRAIRVNNTPAFVAGVTGEAVDSWALIMKHRF